MFHVTTFKYSLHKFSETVLHQNNGDFKRQRSVFVYVSGVSTTSGNLVEFEIPSGNTGNLLEFNWFSWKFLYNRSMVDN